MTEFARLQEMVDKLKNTSKATEKKEILSKYPDLKKILNYTFNSFKQYYVSSDNILKNWKAVQLSKGPNLLGASGRFSSKAPNVANTPKNYFTDIYQLLDALDDRKLTGMKAIDEIISFINRKENLAYKNLILNILDRDLQCKVGASIINKVFEGLIPEFDVALANSYWDHKDVVDFKKDTWYASRKIDGMRLITIIDENGDIKCYSRNGKELTTLERIKEDIRETWPDWKNIVFDGEICIVDEEGNEHFDWAMKEVTRKNYTVPNPRYQVFDCIPLADFGRKECALTLSERYDFLADTFHPEINEKIPRLITFLTQTIIVDQKHFENLFEEAITKGWEGLIIRKDAPYQGKRSNDMLKCKEFNDAEYVVVRAENGPFQITKNGQEVVETMLAKVFILHKGTEVGVGSGFTFDQRREFRDHPENIVGKTITVKYFEETTTEDGKHSLRFPIIKAIYEGGRDI